MDLVIDRTTKTLTFAAWTTIATESNVTFPTALWLMCCVCQTRSVNESHTVCE